MPRLKRRPPDLVLPQATDGRAIRKRRPCAEDCELYNGQDATSLASAIRMSNCSINRSMPYDERLLPFLNASYSQPNCSTGDQQYSMSKHTMLKTMLNVNSNQSNVSQQQGDPAAMLSGHPNVTLAPHPFYDYVSEGQVLRVTTLMSRHPPHFVKGENSATYAFNLTSRQAALFPQSRLREPYQSTENEMNVLLRFCKYDMASEQEDSLPVHLSISCNNMTVPLQCPLPTNKTGMDGRRIGRPVDITNQVYFVPGSPNNLTIHWHYDPENKFQSSVYCLAIFLVRRLTPCDLMTKLQLRLKSDDMSKNMIRHHLSADDSDLSMRCLGASLLCPLGKTRIGLPVRSVACRHVQCFDAFCYLAMNERRPTWRCPTCDEPAPFRDLYVDDYFRSILSKAKSDATRVEFSPDGSWIAKGDDDDDEEEEDSAQRSGLRRGGGGGSGGLSVLSRPPLSSSSCSSSAPTPSCSTAVDAAVIDLTGSDDDEPPPPPPPKKPATPTAAFTERPHVSPTPADSTTNARAKVNASSGVLPPPAPTEASGRRKNPAPTRISCPNTKRPRLRPPTPEVIDLESSDESEVDTIPSYASSGLIVPPLCPPIMSTASACSSACSSSSSSLSSSAPAGIQPPGLPGLPQSLASPQMLHEHGKSSALGALLHPYPTLPGLPGLDHLLPPPPHGHSTGPAGVAPSPHPHPLLSAPRHYAQAHPQQHQPPVTQQPVSMAQSRLTPYGPPGPCPTSPAAVVAAAAAARLSHHTHGLSHFSQAQAAHLASMNSFSFLHYSAGHPNPAYGGSAAGASSGSPCAMPPDGGYYV